MQDEQTGAMHGSSRASNSPDRPCPLIAVNRPVHPNKDEPPPPDGHLFRKPLEERVLYFSDAVDKGGNGFI